MKRSRLTELARIFFKIGLFGFGGQLVVLKMIRDALVNDRRWLTLERFEEGASLSQLLPGPTMFQMATFVGEELHSLLGGAVCAGALIAPAFAAVLILGSLYRASGNSALVSAMFAIIGPAAVALVTAAALQLTRRSTRGIIDALSLACGFAGVAFLHLQPALLLLGIGLVGMLLRRRALAIVALPFVASVATPAGSLASFSALFFSTGALAFGGGQVVVPLLQHDVVERFHWLTAQQFLDGVALGQLTPGPIMITATFIGLLAFGVTGAAIATLGVFLPGFVYMIIARRTLQRWKDNPWLRDFLRTVFSAAIGSVFGAAVLLAELEIHAWWQITALAIALVAASFGQSAPRIFAVAGAAAWCDTSSMYSFLYIIAFSADVTIAKDPNAVVDAIKKDRGSPVLVQFWATWCDGCVREFPHFVKLAKTPGLKVISVSVDLPQGIDSHVRPFLDRQHVTFATLLLDVDDPIAVMHTLDAHWTGTIPAGFLYDKEGKLVLHFFGTAGKNIDKAVASLSK